MRWALALSAVFLVACGEDDQCPNVGVKCDGNVATNCLFRWDNELEGHNALSTEDCGDRFCRTPPDGVSGLAFCSLDSAPDADPALRNIDRFARCKGNVVESYTFGFRVENTTCSDGQVCADSTSPGFLRSDQCEGVAFCSSISGPDPLCAQVTITTCADESTIVYCSCNYRLDAHACANPGPACLIEQDLGVCRAI